jgi:cytosine/adenosine deaminase-related metal-dependent hydrolase
MAQFLKAHAGRSSRATPQAALWRTTLGPSRILGLDQQLGRFAPGMPLSYVEIDPGDARLDLPVEDVITHALLHGHVTPPEVTAVDRLERVGLGAGLELSLLTEDVTRTTNELDAKILSVTIAGQVTWRRGG